MGFKSSSASRASAKSAVAGSIVVINSPTGISLSGGGITANTVIQKQIVEPGANSSSATSTTTSPKIENVYVTDSNWNILDDQALSPAGGYLIVSGTGFVNGCTVYFNNASLTTTFVSSTTLRVVAPASSVGTYSLMVFNPDGNGGIFLNIQFSNAPTFTTAAGSLGTFIETINVSSQITATGDDPIIYSLYSGSLPPNTTLTANGFIYGSTSAESNSNTYSFVVNAKDAQNQDTTRSFSLTINVDTVTWATPADGSTITAVANTALSNVTLSATSASGYNLSYSANTLPPGLTLSGNTIFGTPTTLGSTTTQFTATTSTTNRSATRTVYWVISVAGDTYFKLTSLLLSANTSGQAKTFNTDASLNNINITPVADARASVRNPYQIGYYSNYFDGNFDYLNNTTTTAFGFGTGDFTVESWVMITGTGTTNGYTICDFRDGVSAVVRPALITNASLVLQYYTYNSAKITGPTLLSNRWYHVALSRVSGLTRLFVDGVQVGSTYTDTTDYGTTNRVVIGNVGDNPGSYNASMLGYISNFRVLKGTGRYVTNFTPSVTPLTPIANTVLLTCQSERLRDSGPNNFTLTKGGDVNAVPGNPFTTVYDYGTTYYSTHFDGTGDYLTAPSNAVFTLGTGDFTIEAWIYPTNSSGTQGVLACADTGSAGDLTFFYNLTSGKVTLNAYGATAAVSTASVAVNTWTHVAFVRSSGSLKTFLNGTLDNTVAFTGNFTKTAFVVGRSYSTLNQEYFTGQISNIRVIKGQALYTTTFTPSTTPLTTTSQGATAANVSILTCQDSTLIDNSTNAFTITSNGQAQPQPVSPFTTTNYTTASTTIPTYGSGYFDGTGDYLTVPSGPAYAFGTGDFTIESWVYLTAYNTTYGSQIFGGHNYGISADMILIINTTGKLYFQISGSTSGAITSTSSVSLNTWTHVAIVRSSGTVTPYINGVNAGGGASYTTSIASAINPAIGSSTNGNNGASLTGYISNLRVAKGTALYKANFYPSPTPLTAVSNTQLLTLQYNDGSNNSQFVDSGNFQNLITRAGNTTQGTVSPFSATGWSGYFSSSGLATTTFNVVYSTSASANYNLYSSDSTVELWFFHTALANGSNPTAGAALFSFGTGAANYYSLFITSAGYLAIAKDGDGPAGLGSTTLVTTNVWHHLAWTHTAAGVNKFYLDGVDVTSTFSNPTLSGGWPRNFATPTAFIGAVYYNNTPYTWLNPFNGYISNFRIVKGTIVYSSAFTPPTAPLVAIANTQLLTCQSSSYIDNSPNRAALTTVSGPPVQSFSPFGPVTVTPYYSNYFDGTGDYFTAPANPAFAFGTGDFTIEGWIYNQAGTNRGIFNLAAGYLNSSLSTIALAVKSTTQLTLWYGSTQIDFSSTQADYTWHHVAVVRNSGVIKVYTNGVQTYSAADTTNYTYTYLAVGGYYSTSFLWLGYISNFRVTKGLAVYTGAFTPPTAPLEVTQSSGTNIAAITQASYSNYFDGTGDYLTIARSTPADTAMNFGTGNFTIECWAYFNSFGGANYAPVFSNAYLAYVGNAGQVLYFDGSTNVVTGNSGDVTLNTWAHLAWVRSGTTVTIYVNGVSKASATVSASIGNGSSYAAAIGINSTVYLNGYISNLRVVKGTAVYTSNFTPSTTPLTTTSQGATAANVSLLTCQSAIFSDNSTNSPNSISVNGDTKISGSNPFSGSTMLLTSKNNTFIDNSVNSFTLTVNGDARPTTIAPFAANTTTNVSYSPFGNSGSMYFDGTGDYLTLPTNNPATIMGNSDFTVEAWIYPTTYSGTAQVIAAGQNDQASTTGSSWGLYIASATNSDSYAGSTAVAPGSPNPVKNQWSHVAYVRSGTSLKTYLNGIQVGSASFASATTSVNNGAVTYAPSIGAFGNGGSPFAGYISDLRITKNAVYTSAFVPPANPNRNTVFTRALINGTNGSILDYTGKNNLETVADARLAPQNPYGGSYYSNYFDGTGDYLTLPSSSIVDYGTGDFNFEAWVYLVGSGTDQTIIASRFWFLVGPTTMNLTSAGVATIYSLTGLTNIQGTWAHIAISRQSGTLRSFRNGVLVDSRSNSTNFETTGGKIGIESGSLINPLTGYISNLRSIKGQAIYTAAFTPSTTPLTTTSQGATAANVKLLTCQNSTFIDNSTNAYTITKSGDATVNSANPFQNNGTYSMYFDGTGDWLVTPDKPELQFGAGDFTVEAWVYPTYGTGNRSVVGKGTSTTGWALFADTTGYWAYTDTSTNRTSSTTVQVGVWTHLALVRSGTSLTLYVNGVSVLSSTSSTNFNQTNQLVVGAGRDLTIPWYGYIADLRITKYARYTGTFTPPTEPYFIK